MNISANVLHVYNPTGEGIGLGDPLPTNGAQVLMAGSWAAAIVSELEQLPQDIHIDKYRMSTIAAVISWVGLMHSYRWTVADTVVDLGWGTGKPWAIGYIMLAILLFYVDWQERRKSISSKK